VREKAYLCKGFVDTNVGDMGTVIMYKWHGNRSEVQYMSGDIMGMGCSGTEILAYILAQYYSMRYMVI
jgi:hypothetical protein